LRTQDTASDGSRPGEDNEIATLSLAFTAHRPLFSLARCTFSPANEISLGRGEPSGEVPRLQPRGHWIRLEVPDPFMSSNHAQITRALGRWVLQDCGSRNGVRVNGVPVTSALLGDGDVIECGYSFFVFRVGATGLETWPGEQEGNPGDELATLNPALLAERQALHKVAPSKLPVLLRGESGSGKEVFARALHVLSGRTGPFVPVNCGAFTPSLMASELFGHRKGAFSGAQADHPGLIRSSDGGTLLLDEIGELPLEAQPLLLRVLETQDVLPVGGTRAVPVDLRLVSATHQDLEAAVKAGTFRADLYARLAGHVAHLVPLRERKEDMGLLTARLLRRSAGKTAEQTRFSREATRALFAYDWPLNVRELQHTLERAIALCPDGPIGLQHLPSAMSQSEPHPPKAPASPTVPEGVTGRPTREELSALLTEARGNLTGVARALGKDRTQLRRWLKHHHLDVTDFRAAPGTDKDPKE